MSNKNRGEVALPVGDVTYTLRFSVNAICTLEELLDKGIADIIEELRDTRKMRMKTFRAVVLAGLSDKQPDLTIKDAGEIISGIGQSTILDKLGEALVYAFPPKEAKSDEPNP